MCNVTPWTEGEHDARDKEWCPVTRLYIAADQASWFLRIVSHYISPYLIRRMLTLIKGEKMEVGKSIELGFHQDLDKPLDSISTHLIYSNALNPSDRCDETVKELCQVRWARVPDYDSLPSWKNSKGTRLKRLSYIIKMTSNGVSLDFEISHEGRIVASKNVVVDYSESGAAACRSSTVADDADDAVSLADDDDSGTYVPAGHEGAGTPANSATIWPAEVVSRVNQVWGGQNWDEYSARVEARQRG
jgi:hypothetical protein